MAEELIDTVTPESIAEILRAAGCRVSVTERNGAPQLSSAVQGANFVVRFGNESRQKGSYLDCTFGCAVKTDSPNPPGFVNEWNRTRRFARLWEQDDLMVLEMDLMVAGGIRQQQLGTMIEVWDRLVAEFVDYVRRSRTPAAGNA